MFSPTPFAKRHERERERGRRFKKKKKKKTIGVAAVNGEKENNVPSSSPLTALLIQQGAARMAVIIQPYRSLPG